MAIFAVANTLTALIPIYTIMLAGRVIAGIAAGLAWAVLAALTRADLPRLGWRGRRSPSP